VTQLKTRLTELLGIQHPVIQTEMGWVAGARLTAATSAASGLGLRASSTMTLGELRSSLEQIKARTERPFGVNFRSDNPDVVKVVDLMIEIESASPATATRRARTWSRGSKPRTSSTSRPWAPSATPRR
jgi:NAD(P)H-dependent flavin oxidoreductase YrpB (nitropropane dioxygenase family)